MNIHIVTLNTKSSNNPSAARKFIEAFRADVAPEPVVFCAQELDVNAPRSGHVNVPRLLAGDDPFCFASSILFSPRNAEPTKVNGDGGLPWFYGLGTFVSGAGIVKAKKVPLGPDADLYWRVAKTLGRPIRSGYEPRTALMTDVAVGDRSLCVVNVHLAHSADRSKHSPVRFVQAKKVAEIVDQKISSGKPVVVAGDFNATRENPLLALFSARLSHAPVEGPTKITKQGPVQVDHHFYRGLELVGSPRVLQTGFSDHAAVAATYRLG